MINAGFWTSNDRNNDSWQRFLRPWAAIDPPLRSLPTAAQR
jgi:hypothetical protein